MKIVGCVVAKELTTCEQGANQHAHIVLRKNVVPREKAGNDSPSDKPGSETAEMSISAMKRIATMNDVTKSYFGGLDDTKAEEFLKKSVEDQDKEAADVKKAADDAAQAAELAKSGQSAVEAELQKTVTSLTGTVAELQKQIKENAENAEIEKTAASADFASYPGGPEKVASLLKSYRSLPEADRTAAIDAMKAHAALNKRAAKTIGLRPDENDVLKSQPATAEIEKKVVQLREKEPELGYMAAKARVLEANPDLMARALEEERAPA